MLQPVKSYWSASPVYVSHHPQIAKRSTQSQPQKSQRKTAASQNQRNTVYGQPLTLVLVPKCTDCINQSLCQKSAPLDHALTKVNVGQTCGKTLAAAKTVFVLLPRVNRRFASLELEPIKSGGRNMCDEEMSEMSSNVDSIYTNH